MKQAITRRSILLSGTALAVTASVARAYVEPAGRLENTAALANRAPLADQPFALLPTGAIKPAGWLRRQLEIQAHGLGGRLDETWPDVGPDSGWLGGKGESWERGPYFLDGLLPLAWQLDDPALKAKAQRFIDWTLDNPWPNGMIGPRSNDDWWPRMVALKVLTQYHELTGDRRVIPVMTNYFVHQLGELPTRPLRDWGRFRWQDEVVSIVWLYNRTGDARLIELAGLLKQQGFDWQGFFVDFPYHDKVTLADIALDDPATQKVNALKDPALSVHGVNNAQALKASPVWSLFSGAATDRDAIHRQLAVLDHYHGLPIGIFSADEHFAGRSPSQGVELCAIVETLFSLEHALAITGDARLGDRIERIAYNALPAAFTDDMWAHQYDQQPNQVQCSRAKGPWTTNGPESNLFGLDPHFGCCTANFHQAWPKLTASLWLGSSDGGLAAAVYAPCEVHTQAQGVAIEIREETDYPFRDRVTIHIAPERSLSFPLSLRLPEWCATEVRVNGVVQPAAKPGSFARIEREWRKGDRVEIVFANTPRPREGFNGSTSFDHGPLVFALPIEERWAKWRDRALTADWEVFPASEWRYGVRRGAVPERIERQVGPVPFSRRSPAAVLVAEGLPVAGWDMIDGSAAAVPAKPEHIKDGKPVKLVLFPYAASKLRLTSFPTFDGA
jgi:uncharacterized protein